MTTSVQSLASWLLERITEDEATLPADDSGKRSTSQAWWSNDFEVVFIEEDRFRAECEAKRQLIEQAQSMIEQDWALESYQRVLRLLAVPYADREGYRDEWRP